MFGLYKHEIYRIENIVSTRYLLVAQRYFFHFNMGHTLFYRNETAVFASKQFTRSNLCIQIKIRSASYFWLENHEKKSKSKLILVSKSSLFEN
jgi:hypothetical protein